MGAHAPRSDIAQDIRNERLRLDRGPVVDHVDGLQRTRGCQAAVGGEKSVSFRIAQGFGELTICEQMHVQ